MPEIGGEVELKMNGVFENTGLQAASHSQMDAIALKVQHDVMRLAFQSMKLPDVEPLDVPSVIFGNKQPRAIRILQEKMSEYERTIRELQVEVKARNRFIEELLGKQDRAAFGNQAI